MDKKQQVHIAGWVTPLPAQELGGMDFCNQEQYDLIADCGIRCMYAIFERSAVDINGKNANERALEYASNAGVSYYVWDNRLKELLEEGDREKVWAQLEKYTKFPAFAGILLKDEPNKEELSWLVKMQEIWKTYLPEKDAYVNLYPVHVDREQCKFKDGDDFWEDYVKVFLQSKQKRLSYDLYPLTCDDDGNPTQQVEFLYNLEQCAELAKEANVPLWVFIQAMSYSKNHRHPDEAALRWQIMTSFAYGAKGLQYFCYFPPIIDDLLLAGDGFVTKEGKPSDVYYNAKKIHQEIFAIEKDYTRYHYVGVMPLVGTDAVGKNFTYDLLKKPLQSHKRVKSVTGTQDTLVGVSEDGQGKTALFIVNYCDPYYHQADEVRIQLNGVEKLTAYIGGKKQTVESENDVFVFKLQAGDGIFVMLDEEGGE